MVCPERVLPDASVMVADNMTGTSISRDKHTARCASMAALAFSVSKMVSIRIRSAPPSINPSIWVW